MDDLSLTEVITPILRQRVRSLIGVPLLAQDRVIGVVHVGTAKPRKFMEDDLGLLQLVADRAASAIDRARAEEECACLLEREREAAAEAEEQRARFHRTRWAQEERIAGLGLGLYISRGLVEAHVAGSNPFHDAISAATRAAPGAGRAARRPPSARGSTRSPATGGCRCGG